MRARGRRCGRNRSIRSNHAAWEGRTNSGDLLAGVLVPHERRLGCDLDAVLDDLASRNAEIVRLQIGAQEAEGLRTVSLM